jgi:hypothetical protein
MRQRLSGDVLKFRDLKSSDSHPLTNPKLTMLAALLLL